MAKIDTTKYKHIKKSDLFRNKRYVLGSIIQYRYNPKYREILPFWDKFPTIIIINYNSTHILGLNIHFVPTRIRKKIIDYIFALNKDRIKNNQPLFIKYSILKRMIVKLRATICIRKYIISRMSPKLITPISYSAYKDAVQELETKKIYGMSQDKIYMLMRQYTLKSKRRKK